VCVCVFVCVCVCVCVCGAIFRWTGDPHVGNGHVSLRFQAYKMFDINRDGTIEYEEFVATLRTMELGMNDRQMYDTRNPCSSVWAAM